MTKHGFSCIGILLLLIADHASADPLQPTVSEKERLAIIDRGKALARQQRYPEALESLRKALFVRPDPNALLWVGYVQQEMGLLLDAKAAYIEAKSVAHTSKLERAEQNAERALVELTAKIPRIAIKLPSGVKAKVTIDGKEVQASYDGAEVDPGVHSVAASAPGRRPYDGEVIAEPGKVHVVEPVLTQIPPPRPARPAPSPPVASSGPPAGAVVVSVLGGTIALAGGALLAVGMTPPDGVSPEPTAAGVAMMVGGLGMLAGGVVWGLKSKSAPVKELRARQGRPRDGAQVRLGLSLAPSPQGAWVGLGGQL